MRNTHLVLFVLASLCGRATAQSKVLVVAPTGPWQQIQAAVNQAVDGDTLLVKSGSYSAFSIDNKRINVVAEYGASVIVNGTVHVNHLAAGRVAALVGLHIKATTGATNHALELLGDAGSVRLEACTFEGAGAPTAGHAAKVDNCTDVSFVRCSLIGGNSFSQGGGAGLRQANSQVAAYETSFRGGHGGSNSCGCQARAGGDGAYIDLASFLFASHSSFQGGTGGNANTSCLCTCGADGGWGGNGLRLLNNSVAKLLDNGLAGGPGGQKDCGVCGGCGGIDGPAGQPIAGVGATVLAGASRMLNVANPVRGLASFTVTATGSPGDQVYVWVTPATKFRWVPTYNGVQFNRVDGPPHFLGTIGSSGSLSRSFAWSDLGAGIECGNLFLQAAMREPTGSFTFSSPVSMVVIDQSF